MTALGRGGTWRPGESDHAAWPRRHRCDRLERRPSSSSAAWSSSSGIHRAARISRGEARIRDQGAAGGDQVRGVQPLFAVADRQRDEHRGGARGGKFADGAGARAGNHQVRRGVGLVHGVDVFDLAVAGGGQRVAAPSSTTLSRPVMCRTWTPAAARLGKAAGDRGIHRGRRRSLRSPPAPGRRGPGRGPRGRRRAGPRGPWWRRCGASACPHLGAGQARSRRRRGPGPP